MRIEQLEYFLMVAKYGSLSQACLLYTSDAADEL